jgi:arylsulfatase
MSKWTRREWLTSMGGGALAAGIPLPAAAQQGKRPNIVLMMADDMGFSDLGCYGGEIATPNLDRLARAGVRFTQFYNTARCCPTRASLMTGLYPHQTGVGHMVDAPKPFPGYTGDLNAHCVTIAEVLRPAGYRTWMAGKWHVTPVTTSKHNWPLQRGFEKFYGIIHGAGSFYDPPSLVRGNEFVKTEGESYYFTDAIADEAAGNIRAHDGKDPFFLYLAFTAPHWPLHALEKDVAKYRGRYDAGWDALREERRKRMVEMGIIDANWVLTERDPEVPAWDAAPDKAWQARRMEVYAAQVDAMDQAIGRVLRALEEKGELGNTLVLFLADNGGCAEELRRGPNWQRPFHVPEKAPDGGELKFGNDPAVTPGGADTYQSYGVPWANVSNTPFRLYKHWVHEGGISTPLIAHWPAALKNPGSLRNEPGHLIDIMATCADVAQAAYPKTRQGGAVTPLEGRSFAPLLRGRKRREHEYLFFEHEGNRAVRAGRWKLVSRFSTGGEWELYDLVADRSETRNLAGAQPDRVRRMRQAWEQWAKRALVEDWDKVRKAPRQPIPGSLYPGDQPRAGTGGPARGR